MNRVPNFVLVIVALFASGIAFAQSEPAGDCTAVARQDVAIEVRVEPRSSAAVVGTLEPNSAFKVVDVEQSGGTVYIKVEMKDVLITGYQTSGTGATHISVYDVSFNGGVYVAASDVSFEGDCADSTRSQGQGQGKVSMHDFHFMP